MKRACVLLDLVVLLGLCLAAGQSLLAQEKRETSIGNRPNILFIAVDDLNDWVGPWRGNPQTSTPHIDRLAQRGVRFLNSHCPAPVCNPSRAALMSGLRPSSTGVYSNDDDWRTVIPPEQTLISTFREAGYYTAGAGKIYHGGYDRKEEWDDYLRKVPGDPKPTGSTGVGGIKFAPLDANDEDLADYKIVSYGIEQLQKKHDKPFLLTIGLHKPHMPWNVPRKYFDLHPLDQIKLPPVREDDLDDLPPSAVQMARPEGDHKTMLDSGRWKEAVQAYLAAISFADAQIGRLIEALDNSVYADNTLVVLWGDHGWHLGEKQHWRKFTLWEEATRAPLIWVGPGIVQGSCQRPVDFMSIFPTLTDLAGIPTPSHVQGKSIRKLLGDPEAAWDEAALTTYNRGNHAVRTQDWRYIRYAGGDEELYDEQRDPNEWNNLADEQEFAAKKAELARYLPNKDAPDLNGKRDGRGGAKKRAKAKARAR